MTLPPDLAAFLEIIQGLGAWAVVGLAVAFVAAVLGVAWRALR